MRLADPLRTSSSDYPGNEEVCQNRNEIILFTKKNISSMYAIRKSRVKVKEKKILNNKMRENFYNQALPLLPSSQPDFPDSHAFILYPSLHTCIKVTHLHGLLMAD